MLATTQQYGKESNQLNTTIFKEITAMCIHEGSIIFSEVNVSDKISTVV